MENGDAGTQRRGENFPVTERSRSASPPILQQGRLDYLGSTQTEKQTKSYTKEQTQEDDVGNYCKHLFFLHNTSLNLLNHLG
jgi:hypothetical protein